jgi:hypothetical protein
MATDRFAEAEQALRVAVSQSPRNLAAHELLGLLYRQHLDRPAEAFAHEGRASSLRIELASRQRAGISAAEGSVTSAVPRELVETPTEGDASWELPAPFGAQVDRSQIITVVSGLPRSGTSLMMQLLTAAGREALTDGKRASDEDNPLGYFEFEQARELARDHSWLPQARGKVVKIVAQLLPYLPPGEHYNIVLMERNLAEVIASQNAMLTRQGRAGAKLDGQQLLDTYAAQLRNVRAQLARRPHIRVLVVNYGELLADPAAGADRVALFLGGSFDRAAAAAAVRPQLRRQKV